LLINLTLILIFIIFLLDILINKDTSFLKESSFWIIVFFFLSLLVNVFFSIDPSNSLPRVLKILLIISLVIQLKKNFNKFTFNYEKIIFGFWSLVFLVVILDTIFEMVFGYNTLGYTTGQHARVSSFFGEELVLGGFFFAFGLIFFVYTSQFLKNYNTLNFFLILFLIMIAFFIGERSNFIKFFISIFLLSFFIIKIKLRYKITSFILIIIPMIFIILNSSYHLKNRYFNSLEVLFKEGSVKAYLKQSTYGAHYNAAYKIFQNNLIFGVGVKNYRVESPKKKYENIEYKFTEIRATTHPHQFHYELLSETGLLGYLSFLIFIIFSLNLSIRNFYKHKNLFQLSAIIYIMVSLIPILPSGSFFSTFSSGLFWINYAIMIGYNKK